MVARFTTPPTPERKALINTLIGSLIDAGVWAKLDCLYVTAAADAQAGRQNWVQDAYNLTTVNSPTFTADRGYQGNGSTSYLGTGLQANATVKYAANDAVIGAWLQTWVGGGATRIEFGDRNAFKGKLGGDFFHGAVRYNAGITSAAFTGPGHIAASRLSGANFTFYGNGLQNSVISALDAAPPANDEFRVCGAQVNGNNFFGANRVAAAHVGAGLTPGQIASMYTALNTYLQAVGAV